MVYHIELQIQRYALSREAAIRLALEQILPGIGSSWLTYTLHGGGIASATLTPRVEVDDPRALAAALTHAVVFGLVWALTHKMVAKMTGM